MKHIARQTHDFVSDDGRLGIYMEMEGLQVVSVVLTKKSGPKVEFKMEDLKQLAEVSEAASAFLQQSNSVAEG